MPLVLKLGSFLPCTFLSKNLIPLQLHATKSNDYAIPTDQAITRRSADFKPTIWHHDYIQSLCTKYNEESYAEESRVLREEVRKKLHKMEDDDDDTLHQLELIDVLQRLGVAYHFDAQINNILQNHFNSNIIVVDNNNLKGDKNMYATSLEFRLLRQHGYHLSTEVFDNFQDEMGSFKSFLSEDIKGMLSLYEASFHGMEDETILEKARDFTTKHLKEYVEVRRNKENNNDEMLVLIKHALELPLNWRVQRLEARWFINAYERSPNMIPSFLQLAKLDFNMLQTIYQEELKHASRWWQEIGIIGKLKFARDRLVEAFICSQGMSFEPNHGYFRIVMTKVISFIAILDDLYDVYGTLEELELFTQAVERWDINSMDDLPDYMKLYFLGLFNFVNELTFDILKEKELYILSSMKKVWTDLCKAHLREARWYYNGYTPSLQEYMENAWMTISAPLMLFHSYFLIPHPIREEDFHILKQYPNLLRLLATVFRLTDDLGTSKREMETGDVPKSIQCYMNEHKASEAEARAHVRWMINETWKKMNQEYYCHNSCLSPKLRDICMNLARTAIWCYQYGDGYSDQDPHTNHSISSLLFEPI